MSDERSVRVGDVRVSLPDVVEILTAHDPPLRRAVQHNIRVPDTSGPIVLTPVLAEDWGIFARDARGQAYEIVTELWEEWLDLPEGAAQEKDALTRYMLPIAFHRGYFHHIDWWDPLDEECSASLPLTTIDGAAPWWEKPPTLDMPLLLDRAENEALPQPVDAADAESRLLRAIFGEPNDVVADRPLTM